MRHHTPIARKLVAIIGFAALLLPAALHAEAPLRDSAPGSARITNQAARVPLLGADTLRPATLDLRVNGISGTAAAPSANEIARTNLLSVYERLAELDAQRLPIEATPAEVPAPSWLALSEGRLLPGGEVSIVSEPSLSESAVRASRGENAAITAMVIAAAMLGMVAVAVGTAVMQAEILTD